MWHHITKHYWKIKRIELHNPKNRLAQSLELVESVQYL